MKYLLSIVIYLFMASSACTAQAPSAIAAVPRVHVLPVPEGAIAPDVALDKRGVVHLIYGLNHNAYYQRFGNNGRTFTPAVKVNSTGTVVTTMGERGPKLAVGPDGVIHVAWADQWVAGAQCYVRYARSTDGGKTFSPRQTVSAMPGVDGTTLTVDNAGNVLVFWHVMVAPSPAEPQATWLHMARSSDNGVSFGASEKVKIRGLDGVACSMCLMRARCGKDGNIYLAFRNAQDNVRDFYVLKGKPAVNDFTAIRVNDDNWVLNTCPMCGPELTVDQNGRFLCAFMSRGHVYWAASDPSSTSYKLHVATPTPEHDEIYPSAVANKEGMVLFLWQVGPMSTSGTATVKWALYDKNGVFTGKHATVGVSSSSTKAAAFAGTDGDFYIITSAK